ncbi:hypothetical protein PAXRUDRAFT_828482 [Paxillus rubicundulus Ve08.2h10]|uniref:IRG-type G domain-containing protein n=1 Tax=Paxillus rubicundulus Ve08.2h10 TaxID=930991 RepID=A0A0D0DPN6_9AGAM|nr:hypothetical protein PAXRUDRAFT_828482 [Paxillus rubicundulus Ve08.2h10]
MGAVVSSILSMLDAIRNARVRENPTLADMNVSADAEKAQAEAQAAKADAKRAWEEVKVMRGEAEKRRAEERQRQRAAAAHTRAPSGVHKVERHAGAEEVERVASPGVNDIQGMFAQPQRAEENAKKRAKQVQRKANRRARAAKKAQMKAEGRLERGIQPVVMPSHKEMEAAKRKVQYVEGLFHFAVAGVAGGGKSSFINAFRGIRNYDALAAPTGVTETTLVVSRLPDPNKENPFVWYDIPGVGTMKVPDWQYFNEQGLYVFDCIVVVLDSRFTTADIAILRNCKRFDIPTYIVRSKSDIHIRNIMRDRPGGYDGEDENADHTRRKTLYAEARKQYIAETRANIKQNLEDAELPDQRVYMVSNSVLCSIVKNQNTPPEIIDELELMKVLLSDTHSRRCAPTL